VNESELRHREVFRGRWARPLAWVIFALGAYFIVDAIRRGTVRDVVVVASAVAVASLIVYATAFRPAVVIDDAGVLLRNIVRDIYVPWPRVTDVENNWVLAIEAEGQRYVAWAVSARNPAREGRSGNAEAGILAGRMVSPAMADAVADAGNVGRAEAAAAGTPSARVMDRWLDWRHKVPDGPVTVTPQWPIAVALAVAVTCFALATVAG